MRFHARASVVLLIGIIALVRSTAHAQVTITVIATADSTGLGYTAATPYTFIFTTGASFASTPSSNFDINQQDYVEATTADPQLWSTISGTGLGGSYVRPAGDPADPQSFLRAYDDGDGAYFLLVKARADGFTTTDIGNLTLNSTLINQISFTVSGGPAAMPNFLFPQAHVNPSTYFATYAGTYGSFGIKDLDISTDNFTTTTSFTVSSVTISAIPEPSTYAAFAGVAALGLAILRRRKQAA